MDQFMDQLPKPSEAQLAQQGRRNLRESQIMIPAPSANDVLAYGLPSTAAGAVTPCTLVPRLLWKAAVNVPFASELDRKRWDGLIDSYRDEPTKSIFSTPGSMAGLKGSRGTFKIGPVKGRAKASGAAGVPKRDDGSATHPPAELLAHLVHKNPHILLRLRDFYPSCFNVNLILIGHYAYFGPAFERAPPNPAEDTPFAIVGSGPDETLGGGRAAGGSGATAAGGSNSPPRTRLASWDGHTTGRSPSRWPEADRMAIYNIPLCLDIQDNDAAAVRTLDNWLSDVVLPALVLQELIPSRVQWTTQELAAASGVVRECMHVGEQEGYIATCRVYQLDMERTAGAVLAAAAPLLGGDGRRGGELSTGEGEGGGRAALDHKRHTSEGFEDGVPFDQPYLEIDEAEWLGGGGGDGKGRGGGGKGRLRGRGVSVTAVGGLAGAGDKRQKTTGAQDKIFGHLSTLTAQQRESAAGHDASLATYSVIVTQLTPLAAGSTDVAAMLSKVQASLEHGLKAAAEARGLEARSMQDSAAMISRMLRAEVSK
ncbi:hypothetical protein T492DRAFT_912547 [Pavlovales sp. CCMP2436]|nr:hypothetical protein T492DRAFT_912547 [Pavlovales sp. CCMP2436]